MYAHTGSSLVDTGTGGVDVLVVEERDGRKLDRGTACSVRAVSADVAGADRSVDCARVPSPFKCVERRFAVGSQTAGLGVTVAVADVVTLLVRVAVKRGRAGGNCG